MIRSRLIGVAKLGVITLGLGGAAVGGVLAKRSKSSAVSVPRESVLVIGEAPRWTQAPAVGDVETHGEDAIGYPRFAGVPVGQGPQRGGGELGFDDEGWEGDPWAEPAAIGGPLDRGIERPMLPGEWSGFEPGCGGGECDGGAGGPVAFGDAGTVLGVGGGNSDRTAGGGVPDEPREEPPVEESAPSVPTEDLAPSVDAPTVERDASEGEPTPAVETDPPEQRRPAGSVMPGGDQDPSIGDTEGPQARPEVEAVVPEPEPERDEFWSVWLVGSLVGLLALGAVLFAASRQRVRLQRPRIRARGRGPGPTLPNVPVTAWALDYAAEIGALLQKGLMAVGWQPQGRALSLTARHVSGNVPIDDPRYHALHELVRIAEYVRFAGTHADAQTYLEARAAFDAMQRAAAAPGPDAQEEAR